MEAGGGADEECVRVPRDAEADHVEQPVPAARLQQVKARIAGDQHRKRHVIGRRRGPYFARLCGPGPEVVITLVVLEPMPELPTAVRIDRRAGKPAGQPTGDAGAGTQKGERSLERPFRRRLGRVPMHPLKRLSPGNAGGTYRGRNVLASPMFGPSCAIKERHLRASARPPSAPADPDGVGVGRTRSACSGGS